MRRRTGAFHADNYEDYLEKVKENDAKSGGVSQHISPFNYLAPEDRSKITCNENEPNLDLMQMMYRSQPGRPPHEPIITTTSGIETEETDELALDPVDNTSPTNMPAEEEPLSFNPDSPILESLVVKAMVIGASEVKRHAFIHSLVPGGDSEERLAMKSPLDFVVKTDRSGEKVVKYHFWIKECSRSDEIDRFRSIYNTYYNSVSSFIFVYNVWDKETLSAVRKTIEEVKRSISKEFKAILVGVTSSEADFQREVKISEGENIVTQEGLSEFVETDLTDNYSSSTEKVARFLKSVAESQQLRLKLKKQ